MNPIKFFHPFIKVVGHRGCAGAEKENTLASFSAACMRSYYAIETDIHATKDNKIVIIHDSNLKRLAGIDRNIEDMTLEEVKQVELLDMDGKNPCQSNRIPMFYEYLDCCIRHNKRCVIELKEDFSIENIKQVLSIIEERNYFDKCIFISFWVNNLIKIRELRSDANIQYLLENLTDEAIDTMVKYHFDLDMRADRISFKQVRQMHRLKIKVNVWTLDQKKHARLAVLAGVDFITSNILE